VMVICVLTDFFQHKIAINALKARNTAEVFADAGTHN
jgi:hypothetical protein